VAIEATQKWQQQHQQKTWAELSNGMGMHGTSSYFYVQTNGRKCKK
jgi:hypothetical protein